MENGIEVDTFVRSFDQLDRAITDGEENGIIKVHVRKGTDKILGATIVAGHAGEMISEITSREDGERLHRMYDQIIGKLVTMGNAPSKWILKTTKQQWSHLLTFPSAHSDAT